MFSDMFVKLWQQNLFLLGVWQTVYMTVISTVFAYVLGLPLGLLLCVSDKDGIHPMPVLNKILSILINAFRSVQQGRDRNARDRRRAVRGAHGRVLHQGGR